MLDIAVVAISFLGIIVYGQGSPLGLVRLMRSIRMVCKPSEKCSRHGALCYDCFGLIAVVCPLKGPLGRALN